MELLAPSMVSTCLHINGETETGSQGPRCICTTSMPILPNQKPSLQTILKKYCDPNTNSTAGLRI